MAHQARRKDSPRASNLRRRMAQGRRLFFEPLEPRRVLATFTVTSLEDVLLQPGQPVDQTDGLTLREAIELANAEENHDIIEFSTALGAGIVSVADSAVDDDGFVLDSGELVISEDVTIDARTLGLIRIGRSTWDRDGSPDGPVDLSEAGLAGHRIFRIEADAVVEMRNVVVMGGRVGGDLPIGDDPFNPEDYREDFGAGIVTVVDPGTAAVVHDVVAGLVDNRELVVVADRRVIQRQVA